MLRQVSAAASHMDSTRSSKRRGRGGFKGMLRPFYRPSSNKVKPSPSPPATDQRGRMKMMNQQKSNMNMITATRYYNKVPSITTSTAASSVGTVIVNQDHLPKHITATTGGVDSYNNAARMDALYGGPQVDESVDLKLKLRIISPRFWRGYDFNI